MMDVDLIPCEAIVRGEPCGLDAAGHVRDPLDELRAVCEAHGWDDERLFVARTKAPIAWHELPPLATPEPVRQRRPLAPPCKWDRRTRMSSPCPR